MASHPDPIARQAEATIDLAALRANLRVAVERAGAREVMGVVKADAYGHGAVGIARALVAAGCTRLAVVTVDEAVALRDAGVSVPLMHLGPIGDAAAAAAIVAHCLTPVVHGERELRLLTESAGAEPVPVQLEVESGMHRMGATAADALDLAGQLASSERFDFEGAFTHLACADEPDLAASLEQLARFREWLSELAGRGIRPRLVHYANSAALLAGAALERALPEANLVRPGLMLYGIEPAPHLAAGLRPVMTLRARVVRLQVLSAGDAVGYGATWRAEGATRVATLPLGYADGIPWRAGNRARVWLAGRERPIIGRVSMDYITVGLGVEDKVALGSEAIVFGTVDEAHEQRVEALAASVGQLHYEIVSTIGARVPRRVVG